MKIEIDNIEKLIVDNRNSKIAISHALDLDSPGRRRQIGEASSLSWVLGLIRKQKEAQAYHDVVDKIKNLSFVDDVTMEGFDIMVRMPRFSSYRADLILDIDREHLGFDCSHHNVYTTGSRDLAVFKYIDKQISV